MANVFYLAPGAKSQRRSPSCTHAPLKSSWSWLAKFEFQRRPLAEKQKRYSTTYTHRNHPFRCFIYLFSIGSVDVLNQVREKIILLNTVKERSRKLFGHLLRLNLFIDE